MTIVIAGASGLVGSALTTLLRAAGHEVRRLVRGGGARAADEIAWKPEAGEIDQARLEGVDALINLAGENLGARRWTAARREAIRRSRIDATRTLVAAVGRLSRKPAVLLNASAVGFYGDRGDEVLTEASVIGRGFLSDVCLEWETTAGGATQFGVRIVLLRFGVILAANGGALAKMLPLFRSGLGGRLGSGEQWMSWVAIDDVVGVVHHALADARCVGPINVVAPAAVTNVEFTRALAAALHRPAIFPVPAWALRAVVGRGMANEALLASTRVAPRRLSELGYGFRHTTITAALEGVVEDVARKKLKM